MLFIVSLTALSSLYTGISIVNFILTPNLSFQNDYGFLKFCARTIESFLSFGINQHIVLFTRSITGFRYEKLLILTLTTFNPWLSRRLTSSPEVYSFICPCVSSYWLYVSLLFFSIMFASLLRLIVVSIKSPSFLRTLLISLNTSSRSFGS